MSVKFLPGLDYKTTRDTLHDKHHGIQDDDWQRDFATWEEKIVPHIGCGATKCVGSDYYPYIVTRTAPGRSRTRIWVKRLHAVADGTHVGYVPGGFLLSGEPEADATEQEVRWSRRKLGWYLDNAHVSFAGAFQRLDPHF